MAPTAGMSELNIATFPTGLQLSSLLYNANPKVEMQMSSDRYKMPVPVI